VCKVGKFSPRSRMPIQVRSSPAAAASPSCESSFASRSSRRTAPKARRIFNVFGLSLVFAIRP